MKIESPWPLPQKDRCLFYHSIDLPHEMVEGFWDLRGQFEPYIGNVPVGGKSVLDVGTASGFLAFMAEQHGASEVTATDLTSIADQQRVPYADSAYLKNKRQWAADNERDIIALKNGFWYCWHKLNSKVRVGYSTLDGLYSISERFDVVLAGAVIEHLSDPVSAIGAFCRLARETVVIAFTPIAPEPGLFMRPLIEWTPAADYVWWVLSRQLYARIFDGLMFDVRFLSCAATRVENGKRYEVPRETIVATRRARSL